MYGESFGVDLDEDLVALLLKFFVLFFVYIIVDNLVLEEYLLST